MYDIARNNVFETPNKLYEAGLIHSNSQQPIFELALTGIAANMDPGVASGDRIEAVKLQLCVVDGKCCTIAQVFIRWNVDSWNFGRCQKDSAFKLP